MEEDDQVNALPPPPPAASAATAGGGAGGVGGGLGMGAQGSVPGIGSPYGAVPSQSPPVTPMNRSLGGGGVPFAANPAAFGTRRLGCLVPILFACALGRSNASACSHALHLYLFRGTMAAQHAFVPRFTVNKARATRWCRCLLFFAQPRRARSSSTKMHSPTAGLHAGSASRRRVSTFTSLIKKNAALVRSRLGTVPGSA